MTKSAEEIAREFLDTHAIPYGFAGFRLLDLTALIRSAREEGAQQWRAMDSAPRDGTWVLAIQGCDNTKYVGHGVVQWRSGGRNGRGPGWYDDRIFPMDDASHWQPLPAPPTTDTK